MAAYRLQNDTSYAFNSNSSPSFADVSEDDIKLVMEQAQVNRAQAIKALQDHGYARLHVALSRTRPFRALTLAFPAVTLWMPSLLFQNHHRDLNIDMCYVPAAPLWLTPCKVS